jgi:hypothetical protein
VTDLETRVAALLAQAGVGVAHRSGCDSLKVPSVYGYAGSGPKERKEWVVVGCSCDHASRVLAQQAKMVAAGIRKALAPSPHSFTVYKEADAVEVMERALRDGEEKET